MSVGRAVPRPWQCSVGNQGPAALGEVGEEAGPRPTDHMLRGLCSILRAMESH